MNFGDLNLHFVFLLFKDYSFPSSSLRYRPISYPTARTIHWAVIFNQPVVVASVCQQKHKVSRNKLSDFRNDGLGIWETWTIAPTEINYKADKIFKHPWKVLVILTRL